MIEAEQKRDNFKDAIILALHKTMVESDINGKYLKNLNYFLGLFREFDADSFLEQYLFEGQEDQFPR